jgi:DNA-binding transcriptional ArsR family regulator
MSDAARKGGEYVSATKPQSVEASPETASAGAAESGSIDRDELFHILRNQRRRFALHHLKHRDESVDVGNLATQVAAWENEISVEEVTSKQRRRVYNALQQTHVPELEESGVVEVERREIELTERADELDIYLEVVPGADIPWSEYYLALGGVSLAVLVAVALGVGPFAALSGVGVGIFAVVAFLVSAAANYYYQHESLLGGYERPPELRGE